MARVTPPPEVRPSGAPAAGPLPPVLTGRAGSATGSPDHPGGSDRAPLHRRVGVRAWVLASVLVVGLALATFVVVTRSPSPPPLTRADVDAGVRAGIERYAEAQAAAPAVASLAHAAVQPSLVVVSTRSSGPDGGSAGTGAGVVVNADGTVLTAHHVVDGADSVTVQFADGTTSPATVVRADPGTDTATLRPRRLPGTVVPAVLGGGVQVGAPVFAVGHPLGLVDSLSAGVVSALDRTVTVPGGRRLQHLIQFDAAVNPGNSGGPLLDASGHVVGVVTGLANPTDQSLFVGIGFAVPITSAGAGAAPPH